MYANHTSSPVGTAWASWTIRYRVVSPHDRHGFDVLLCVDSVDKVILHTRSSEWIRPVPSAVSSGGHCFFVRVQNTSNKGKKQSTRMDIYCMAIMLNKAIKVMFDMRLDCGH
jgi:hypothetical protein